MKSFIEFLNEEKEVKRNQKEIDEINKRLENDKEAQDLIDEINDDLDSNVSLEESELLEGDGSPFETDGTFYDGITDEVVGKDSKKS